MKEYNEFIKSKSHSSLNMGLKPVVFLDNMFDFQSYVYEYLSIKGRAAGFLDTGTGKTIIELLLAKNYVIQTNKPVLIITPLAVAFQFIKEAEKFGIEDVEYSRRGKYTKKIIICNYEQLEKFNSSDFDCVILDESSILKNFDGAIKNRITSFLKNIKYRYLFTATPSPNDFIELGTSSEALGYLGYTDMLTKYFKNNEDTISPQNIGTKWRLKGHAKDSFFDWVSSWSISMRKPSDLGFSDDKFILPNLITNNHIVKNKHRLIINRQLQMFPTMAKGLKEIRAEQRATINERCEKAAMLAENKDTTVYWVNLNDEGDIINGLDKDSFQIKGSMKLEQKEEMLLSFANGEIKKLITKSNMTSFGLNWQHCNHTVYLPTFSYEQYYQSIRRFWRFGQKREVTVDLVFSEGMSRVMESLKVKSDKANELFDKLNKSVNDPKKDVQKELMKINLPNFLN